jgi:hypothetical protein
MSKICKLSDELGAAFDADYCAVTLYDTRGESPIRREHLDRDEMLALFNLYSDGRCPVCLKEIPLNDVICDDCFRDASAVERP